MRVLVLTILLVLAGRLAAPSEAAAQYHRLTDAVTIGGTLASAGSGSERFTGGAELGGLIEVPLGDEFRIRGEAAAGFWHYDGDPYYGNVPGSGLRRHRLTASVLRTRMPPSPRFRLSGYGGGGAGLYLYRFPEQTAGGWGIHGIVGAEYLLRTMRSRWIVGGELQIHAAGQPRRIGEVQPVPLVSAHVAAVVKYRLP